MASRRATSLAAEAGYGLPAGHRFVGTPQFGLGTSEQGRDYRLGVLGSKEIDFELGIEAQPQERPQSSNTSTGAVHTGRCAGETGAERACGGQPLAPRPSATRRAARARL